MHDSSSILTIDEEKQEQLVKCFEQFSSKLKSLGILSKDATSYLILTSEEMDYLEESKTTFNESEILFEASAEGSTEAKAGVPRVNTLIKFKFITDV